MILRLTPILVVLLGFAESRAQHLDSPSGRMMYDIVDSVSADRIESDIRTLAGFGTRHSLSDTTSATRGIGAARRWIKDEFDRISESCGHCIDVFYLRDLVRGDSTTRIPVDTWIVDVIAIQRGTTDSDRFVVMSGDIDSRVSDPLDSVSDSPGANDNASGMAGTMEAARVLSAYSFPSSIMYAGLSGEEQGLFGGKYLARVADSLGWRLSGVLNNDMIGNIEGIDGVIDNRAFRIFSEPTPVTETDSHRRRRRYTGGEVDGPSRQLARYVDRIVSTFMPQMNPMLVYRLDRFGRGGHHRPFNDAGFAAVRIMEAHENYNRQHQDVREEDGIAYGDVVDGVNFAYAASLTAANAITLAALASAPPAPDTVWIGGAVQPSTQLRWTPVDDPSLRGYKVYWRDTSAPQWEHALFVDGDTTTLTLDGIVIDNYLFGVASVGMDGFESVIGFPTELIPR